MIATLLAPVRVLPYIPRPQPGPGHHYDIVPWLAAVFGAWVLWQFAPAIRDYGPAARLAWRVFTRMSTLITLSAGAVAAGILMHAVTVVVAGAVSCLAAAGLRNLAGRKFAEYDDATRNQDAGTNPLAGSSAATCAYATRVKRTYGR